MVRHKYDEKRIPDEALIFLDDFRIVLLRAETFTNIQKSMEKVHGEEANAALYEAGIAAGHSSTVALLAKWDERGKNFLDRWAEVTLWTRATPPFHFESGNWKKGRLCS